MSEICIKRGNVWNIMAKKIFIKTAETSDTQCSLWGQSPGTKNTCSLYRLGTELETRGIVRLGTNDVFILWHRGHLPYLFPLKAYLDLEREDLVPGRVEGLVLCVSGEPRVVQLQHREGIRAPAQVSRVESSRSVYLRSLVHLFQVFRLRKSICKLVLHSENSNIFRLKKFLRLADLTKIWQLADFRFVHPIVLPFAKIFRRYLNFCKSGNTSFLSFEKCSNSIWY